MQLYRSKLLTISFASVLLLFSHSLHATPTCSQTRFIVRPLPGQDIQELLLTTNPNFEVKQKLGLNQYLVGPRIQSGEALTLGSCAQTFQLASAQSGNMVGDQSSMLQFEADGLLTLDNLPNDSILPFLNYISFQPKLNNPYSTNAAAAWHISSGSSEVVVAIIDTGIDLNDPDLVANLWTNPGEIPNNGLDDDQNGYVDDVHGYNFAENNSNIHIASNFTGWHGNAVAGVIGARGNNEFLSSGVSPNISMMILKVQHPDGHIFNSWVIAALNYATLMKSQGVKLLAVNVSLGSKLYLSNEEIAYQQLDQSGVIVVNSAGNGGDDDYGDNNDFSPVYPNNYNLNLRLGVAASQLSNGRLTKFSNYGSQRVHLAAPGQDIPLLAPLPVNGRLGTGFMVDSGTSFAAPMVVGALGLIRAICPYAAPAEIRDLLLANVASTTELTNLVASGGVLDAYHALTAASVLCANQTTSRIGTLASNRISLHPNSTKFSKKWTRKLLKKHQKLTILNLDLGRVGQAATPSENLVKITLYVDNKLCRKSIGAKFKPTAKNSRFQFLLDLNQVAKSAVLKFVLQNSLGSTEAIQLIGIKGKSPKRTGISGICQSFQHTRAVR